LRIGSTKRNELAASVAIVGQLVVTACGSATHTAAGHQTQAPFALNPLTAGQLLTSMTNAGLAVPNPRDVTQRDCPAMGCTNKVETDTVSVIKFPSSGKAQLYAGSVHQVFQIADIVLTFAPSVPTTQRIAYENAVKRAIERPPNG
jgi:hypothetical protein